MGIHNGSTSCEACSIVLPLGVAVSEERFLCQAKAKFGDGFVYSGYSGASCPLQITCPDHGKFTMLKASAHLSSKYGCEKCARGSLTEDQFMSRIEELYEGELPCTIIGTWTDAKTTYVQVECSKGHTFRRKAAHHLQNPSCQKCFLADKRGRLLPHRVTFEDFVRRARLLHGQRYEYSSEHFSRVKRSTVIICHSHGPFKMRADAHLLGQGCSKCKSSKGEAIVRQFLSEAGVQFTHEWSHESLLSARGVRLRFDFALTKSKILIEFYWPQHFTPVWPLNDPVQARANLKLLKLHDRMKDTWASDNGWTLLRFSSLKTLRSELSSALQSIDSSTKSR